MAWSAKARAAALATRRAHQRPRYRLTLSPTEMRRHIGVRDISVSRQIIMQGRTDFARRPRTLAAQKRYLRALNPHEQKAFYRARTRSRRMALMHVPGRNRRASTLSI